MIFLRIIGGSALLLLGRKLYWLFVGGIGFVVALGFATRIFSGQSEWVIIALAIVAGLVGALLAVFLQKVALGVGGFLGGGYFLLSILELLGVVLERFAWVPFLIGGIVGGIFIVALFDWALIILSSLSGSMIILQSFEVSRAWAILLLFGLFILGIVIQGGILVRERSTNP